ncbi:MAG: alpha/beta hydrolase [Aestuariivirga sp.]
MKFLIAIPIAVYGAAVIFMYLNQRALQYHPENKGLTPESAGISGASVERLATPDGETIVVWYSPPKENKATILYFHGNAGEIGDRPLRFNYFQARGFGVAFVSYRGFGGSTGTISERGLIADATAAYDWLVARNVSPKSIFLLGESLGSGVAVQLAARKQVGALVLEAPYTSTADVAARIYWWLPVRLLMKDQFKSIDFIKDVKAPLLIVHGGQDVLIPVEFGRRLFDAANEPKELAIISGHGHEALFEEATWTREAEFFARQALR